MECEMLDVIDDNVGTCKYCGQICPHYGIMPYSPVEKDKAIVCFFAEYSGKLYSKDFRQFLQRVCDNNVE